LAKAQKHCSDIASTFPTQGLTNQVEPFAIQFHREISGEKSATAPCLMLALAVLVPLATV